MNFNHFVQENGQQVVCKKHEHVFMQGKNNNNLYFLKSGLLKAYYVSENGRESIKSFILPGNSISSLTAAYKNEGCSFSLVALQESHLTQVPFNCLKEATRNSHDIAQKVIEVLLDLSMKKERREYEFLSLTVEERYRQLCETSPELVKAVTQNDIARYLGITPVALSRVKKRLNFE